MSEHKRRDFLGKFSLGLGALISAPFLAKSTPNKSNDKEVKPSILKIRALGFQWETNDPFLFCVHHEDNYPNGTLEMAPDASLDGREIGQDFIIKDGWRMYHGQKVPGFPNHPHRGFETITVVRKGLVDHADSTGAAGRYGNGDVQWMTAGKGVQHSEMFPLLKTDERNPLELFQIWLNLPRKSKMVEPYFRMMWSDTIPNIHLPNEDESDVFIEVIAGKLNDQMAPTPPPDSWANPEENHIGIYNIRMKPGKQYSLPATEEGVNRSIYFYEGNGLQVDGELIEAYHAVDVDPTQEITLESSDEEIKVLVLQGKPIGEPVVQYGPFVMNSRQEIQQAFEDYHETQFGGWPWPENGQTHDRERTRFALHSDGREEIKG